MACVWGCIITLIAFAGSFSTVRFQICPQISCPREGKITVAAFVWLSSTVGFQMSPQMACLWECRIGCMCMTFLHCAFSNVSPNCFTLFTFVAFVWFFSTVCCQMCHQNVSKRRGKVTLVAFVGLFSTVRFQMCPQSLMKPLWGVNAKKGPLRARWAKKWFCVEPLSKEGAAEGKMSHWGRS